jgi:hypothetical protein
MAKDLLMIWFQLIAFFIAWTAVLLLACEVYAWLLRCAARLPRLFRLLLGTLAYLFIVAIIALPMFGFDFLLGPFISSTTIRYVWMQSILGCPWFALVFFYKRHVPTLKTLGFFQSRTYRKE